MNRAELGNVRKFATISSQFIKRGEKRDFFAKIRKNSTSYCRIPHLHDIFSLFCSITRSFAQIIEQKNSSPFKSGFGSAIEFTSFQAMISLSISICAVFVISLIFLTSQSITLIQYLVIFGIFYAEFDFYFIYILTLPKSRQYRRKKK